jgi:hypothetical protein
MITNRPYASLFIEEGGWTLYTTGFRANSANLANKHSTKLRTLIYSAHARTVRPTGADCPDRGLSGLRAGPSVCSFWCQTLSNAGEVIPTLSDGTECPGPSSSPTMPRPTRLPALTRPQYGPPVGPTPNLMRLDRREP